MSFIYIWQNQNNLKIYVGQTNDPRGRQRAHLRRALQDSYAHPLYDSMRHHGVEQFTFQVIEEVDDVHIDEAESFWIDFFRSWDRDCGYNLELGGKRYKRITQVTRQKLSAAARNRRMSDATKEKLRKIHKGKRYRLDHTVSEATRAKLRRSHLKLGPEVLELRALGLSYAAIGRQFNASYGAARNAVRYWENIRSNAPDTK